MMRTLIGSQDETLCEIQRKVRAMLEDRLMSIQDGPFRWPSSYWTDFTSFFDYLSVYYSRLT
jgi:hypothetical protein